MKKQILAALAAVLLSLPASAQFEKGTNYVGASLSGRSLSYSSKTKWDLGIDLRAGHFVADEWLLLGNLNYRFQHTAGGNINGLELCLGARYYITQNGLSLGASVQYEHRGGSGTSRMNSLALCPEVAYTFFINRYLTIEPAVYYNISLNNYADYRRIGLRIGLGYYFKSKSKRQPFFAQ